MQRRAILQVQELVLALARCGVQHAQRDDAPADHRRAQHAGRAFDLGTLGHAASSRTGAPRSSARTATGRNVV
ncbi:MAG: hypothetical protein ACYC3Q_11605 [Gemmatimonadaceae bacterium]